MTDIEKLQVSITRLAQLVGELRAQVTIQAIDISMQNERIAELERFHQAQHDRKRARERVEVNG